MMNKSLQILLQFISISAIFILSITFMSSCSDSSTNDLKNGLVGIWSVDEEPKVLWIFEEDNTFVGAYGSESEKGRWSISNKNKLILESVDPQMEKKEVYEFEIDADRLLIRDPEGEYSFWLTRRSTKDLSEIPSEISKVIFDESDFSWPITLTLPCGDDPESLERLKKKAHGLPPILGSRLVHLPAKGRNLLIQQGFITEEEIEVTWSGMGGRGSKTGKFYHYTDKIKPYIHRIGFYPQGLGPSEKQGDEFSEKRFDECIKKGHYFTIKLASRELESIDYKNKYEVQAAGLHEGYDAFAVIFSYSLQEFFPLYEELIAKGHSYRVDELSLDRTYEGEAKAYCEPDFREWKLESISLEDRRSLLW